LEDRVARFLDNKIATVAGSGRSIDPDRALELAENRAKVVVNDLRMSGGSNDAPGEGGRLVNREHGLVPAQG
jgi:hypothetical protein